MISAVSVLVIIFDALLILQTLQYSGATETIQDIMECSRKDMRIQAIVFRYIFSDFIEKKLFLELLSYWQHFYISSSASHL
jgi:lactate permease